MTEKIIFEVKAKRGSYRSDLNLQIGNELKIIKGKDSSKQGCAILTLDDKFIDFIPSPERFTVWEKLDANRNLKPYATIINFGHYIERYKVYGDQVEITYVYVTKIRDDGTEELDIPDNSPIYSIKILLEFKIINEEINNKFYAVSLVGFKYINNLPILFVNDIIQVKHENQNSHDKLALKVVNESNVKIGYIPMNFHAREDLISKLMANEKISGYIHDIKFNDSLIKSVLLYIAK